MYKFKKIILHFLEPCACLIMLEVSNPIRQALFYDDLSPSVRIISSLHCTTIFLSTLYTGLFNLYTKYLVIKDFQYEE